MRMLTAEKVKLYRRRLENERWVLTREYWKEREGSLAHVQGDPEDSIDLAVRTYTRDFLLSLSEIERHELLLIEDAIRRVDLGAFGRCTECGGGIPTGRLDAIPWAPTCYGCQVEQEALRAPAAQGVDLGELSAA